MEENVRVFHNPEPDYSVNQVERHRLVERKLHCAFRPFVSAQFIFEGFNAGRSWIKPDVVLMGGKVDQDAVLPEGRHSVTDHFHCPGSGFLYSLPDLYENFLNIRREAVNILIDSDWWLHSEDVSIKYFINL